MLLIAGGKCDMTQMESTFHQAAVEASDGGAQVCPCEGISGTAAHVVDGSK